MSRAMRSNEWMCRFCSHLNANRADQPSFCSFCGISRDGSFIGSMEQAPEALSVSTCSNHTSSYAALDEESPITNRSLRNMPGSLSFPVQVGTGGRSNSLISELGSSDRRISVGEQSGIQSELAQATSELTISDLSSKPKELGDNALNMSFASWTKDDIKSWKCPLCTFVNENPLHLTCEICGASRNSATPIEDDTTTQSIQDCSFSTGQALLLGRHIRAGNQSGEEAIEKERMGEIVKTQLAALAELPEEQEEQPKSTPQMIDHGPSLGSVPVSPYTGNGELYPNSTNDGLYPKSGSGLGSRNGELYPNISECLATSDRPEAFGDMQSRLMMQSGMSVRSFGLVQQLAADACEPQVRVHDEQARALDRLEDDIIRKLQGN